VRPCAVPVNLKSQDHRYPSPSTVIRHPLTVYLYLFTINRQPGLQPPSRFLYLHFYVPIYLYSIIVAFVNYSPLLASTYCATYTIFTSIFFPCLIVGRKPALIYNLSSLIYCVAFTLPKYCPLHPTIPNSYSDVKVESKLF